MLGPSPRGRTHESSKRQRPLLRQTMERYGKNGVMKSKLLIERALQRGFIARLGLGMRGGHELIQQSGKHAQHVVHVLRSACTTRRCVGATTPVSEPKLIAVLRSTGKSGDRAPNRCRRRRAQLSPCRPVLTNLSITETDPRLWRLQDTSYG